MDPQPLTPAEWGQLGTSLRYLWIAWFLALVAGPTLLTAHAIIPSLVSTGTIHEKWQGRRRVFYAVGLAAVALVVVCLLLALLNFDWIDTRYSRYWQ